MLPKKCKEASCFENSDCKHARCAAHCTETHTIKEYHSVKSLPHNSKPHLGIEVEVEFPDRTSSARLRAFTSLEHDGSLTNGGEAKLCSTWPQILTRATNLVVGLKDRGARITQTCGLHVHLDTRNLPYGRVQSLFTFAKSTQIDWYNLIPPSRRRNAYVLPLNSYNQNDHYTWLNERGSTVECRLHPGTLNPHKLSGWLHVMHALMTSARDPQYTFPETFDSWTSDRCSSLAQQYISARLSGGGILKSQASNQAGFFEEETEEEEICA